MTGGMSTLGPLHQKFLTTLKGLWLGTRPNSEYTVKSTSGGV